VANPKEDQGERMVERIVILVRPSFKEAYTEMVGKITKASKPDVSKHIRPMLEGELALYDAAKK
jgi:hypothetical protein